MFFERCRVCHSHFEPQHYTHSRRLSRAAVPTLHLEGVGVLLAKCEETAEILKFFDKISDSLNGSYRNAKNRPGKYLLGAVTKKSKHKQLWQEAKYVLKTIKFINKNNTKSGTVPSVTNLLQTIENVEYLVDILIQKYDMKFLWMRHFNQDPLENFFGCLRSHGYRNVSPTCAGFEAAFISITYK